jgi:NDP-sugar pyrophosphorylase family protein
LATRLRPLTEKLPKSLVEVCGEPFLAHQLRLLQRNGIERAVLCVGFQGEKIQWAIGDGKAFGLRVDYSFDGPDLLGTAGAIRNALPLLGSSFFVMYGDSYLTCNFKAVEAAFLRSGKLAMMTVLHNKNQWDASNVEFDGGIVAYRKGSTSSRMQHIDYGLGVFQAEAFRDAPADLAELYAQLLEAGQLAAFEVQERFYEIGSPQGLEQTARFLAERGVAR